MKIVKIFFIAALLLTVSCSSPENHVVGIKKMDSGYQLYRDGKPYYIKGAGALDHYQELAEAGGNSIRTWGADQWDEAFRMAEKYDLTVSAGIWLDQERQGFDYSDPDTIAQQFERIKKSILKYKDHPRLLIWGIGNELNLHYTNPGVWDAVEEVAQFIKKVDGDHPTMTTTAFVGKKEIQEIKQRCPSIDILGVNAYGGLPALSELIDKYGWEKPYILGEWGTFGHWEVSKTSWDAPMEMNSTRKAQLYRKLYNDDILTDPQCLGAYVFLWGSKQERTPTWYSMFLPEGQKTRIVNVMHYLWDGEWPENRSPILDSLKFDGNHPKPNIFIEPGSRHQTQVWIHDHENDPLKIEWEILHETTDKGVGGDAEKKPDKANFTTLKKQNKIFTFLAPQKEGAYRLFIYAYDNNGNGAHANLPFYVKKQ